MKYIIWQLPNRNWYVAISNEDGITRYLDGNNKLTAGYDTPQAALDAIRKDWINYLQEQNIPYADYADPKFEFRFERGQVFNCDGYNVALPLIFGLRWWHPHEEKQS